MSSGKLKILSLIGLSFIALTTFQSFLPEPLEEGNPQFEMNPPLATEFWVQKLPEPLEDGSTMKMMIKYDPLYQLPPSLNIYYGGSSPSYITFYDDGTHADVTSGDKLYSAYIAENVQSFVSGMQSAIQVLNSQGSVLQFSGHGGREVSTQALGFALSGFNSGVMVRIDDLALVAFNCHSIIKQNSLFITDINVVEDIVRTNKVHAGGNGGNNNGVYTFGNMIKKMTGVGAPAGTARKLMKSWVENWTQNVVVNGQIVPHRKDVFLFLIGPWLTKANGGSFVFNQTNWSSQWDATPEADLLANAPFKLTAIVNRLDLRGSAAYTSSVSNAGETRFIYTLENIYTPGAAGAPNAPGLPPVQNFDFSMLQIPVDWRGMNVILEYGNVQKSRCDIKSFANRWYNLSSLPLGSVAFKDSLESIVSTVINAGAAPGRINGSAINRIRTNERIFQDITKDLPGWEASDWEFRQFELDATTGLFKQVPLTNTPANEANNPTNLLSPGFVGFQPSIPLSATYNSNLIDWIFSSPLNITKVLHEQHDIPDQYNGTYLKSGGARVDAEYPHYWDLNWTANATQAPNYNAYGAFTGGTNHTYKDIRRNISLNTCQGCHAGETQTVFAHVLPIGYGETARYWDPVPDALGSANSIMNVDTRFPFDHGTSTGSTSIRIPNYPPPVRDYVKVSAFLTGRTSTSGSMGSLYYLYSPDNDDSSVAQDFAGINVPNVGPHNKQYGYNDLERRLQDLCLLITTDCNPTVRSTFIEAARQPLAIGAH